MFFYGLLTFGGGDAIAEQGSERQTEVPRSDYEDLSAVRDLYSDVAEPEESTEGESEEGSGIDSEGAGLDARNTDTNSDDNSVIGDTSAHNDVDSGGDSRGVDESAEKPQALTFEATAYTAQCDGCIGITKSGVDVRNTQFHEGKRVIATDPDVIPLGTTVVVTLSDGSSFEATAQDIGGAIKGNRIDVLVATKDEAYSFGRQDVEVTVKE